MAYGALGNRCLTGATWATRKGAITVTTARLSDTRKNRRNAGAIQIQRLGEIHGYVVLHTEELLAKANSNLTYKPNTYLFTRKVTSAAWDLCHATRTLVAATIIAEEMKCHGGVHECSHSSPTTCTTGAN